VGVTGLVVFDCDGVLVDSERLAVEIDAQMITEAGWPLTREDVIHRFVGRSEADQLAEIEAHLGHPLPTDWSERWDVAYRDRFAADLEAVPGVRAAVESLIADGFAVCVASSGSHEKIRRNLDLTGLRDLFGEDIFSAQDVVDGKPAPDLFLLAARTMGHEPRRTVVVEDSQYGVTAALAAGMAVVGYAGGVTPQGQLAAADLVIDDMAHLAAAVVSRVNRR
jgi:HAD superfamily hydrolase (TIGR01509 family)